jgi:uncharacterized protein YcbK (DUF882 family)
MDRRKFLAFTIATTVMAPWRRAAALGETRRTLAFRNLHTEDTLRVVYWRDGDYVPEALQQIARVLRDHRNGEEYAIEPALLDLLHELRDRLDTDAPFEVISGYRSPASNAQMKAQGRGVASNSLHTEGKAIDVRVPGRRLEAVRDAAYALGRGGVGYYPQDGFVHVDVGRVRRW